jgi:hypothetical protein
VTECPFGDDEENCTHQTCPKMLRCSVENMCVHQVEICDGVLHCPLSGDDEFACPEVSKCPDGCRCFGRAIYCIHGVQLSYPAIGIFRLKYPLDFEDISLRNAWYVDLSFCGIDSLAVLKKMRFPMVAKLIMNGNPLRDFDSSVPWMQHIKFLEFQNNNLVHIHQNRFQSLNKVEQIILANSEIYEIKSYAFHNQRSLKLLDLSNTSLFSLMSDMFIGLESLEIMKLKDMRIRYVSQDVLQKNSLQMVMIEDVHFCCLRNWEIIPFCKTVTPDMLKEICPMYHPAHSSLLMIYLFLPLGLNTVVVVYIFFGRRTLRGRSFFHAFCWGTLISFVMMAFHFLIEDTTKNQTLQFHFQGTKAGICQLVAILTYMSSLFYPCIIIFHWLEIYLVTKFAIDKDKHMGNLYRLIYLLITASIIIGSGYKMAKDRRENTICEVQFTFSGKVAFLSCQAVLYLCTILSMFAVQRQMEQIRKAAGREKGKFDRALKMRFCWMTGAIIVVSVAHVLQEMDMSNNTVFHLGLLYINQTLLPIAFPILFVLSSRHFKATVKRIFKKCF